MATEIKVTNKVKELARDYDIDILKKQVSDLIALTERLQDKVEKLEAQFTFPTSLSSDWNYIKENPWPFTTNEQAIEYLRKHDTSVSKRPL